MDLEILSFSLWKVNVDRSHADLQIFSLETHSRETDESIAVVCSNFQSVSLKLLTLPCMHTVRVVSQLGLQLCSLSINVQIIFSVNKLII